MYAFGTIALVGGVVLFMAFLFALFRKGPEPVRISRRYVRPDDYGPETHYAPPERQHFVQEEPAEPAQVPEVWFDLPGVRKFTGKRTLRNVPTINPESEGAWAKDRGVVAIFNIHGILPREELKALFVELDEGYALMSMGTKTALLQQIELTSDQLAKLEEERREAADPNNNATDTARRQVLGYLDGNWDIMAACNPEAGSKIWLEGEGPAQPRTFPTPLYSGDRKVYRDIQLKEVVEGKSGRVFVGIFVEGGWMTYVGKRMTPQEAGRISPIE